MAKQAHSAAAPAVVAPPFPQRKTYAGLDQGPDLAYSHLPFVSVPKGRGEDRNWITPTVDDPIAAQDIGREYAAHFAQFLKDCPRWTGSNMLAEIVAAMDHEDRGDMVQFGFLAHIEHMLLQYARQNDVFRDVDERLVAERAAWMARTRITTEVRHA